MDRKYNKSGVEVNCDDLLKADNQDTTMVLPHSPAWAGYIVIVAVEH